MRCLIIGAGMAGLLAATLLQKQGITVTVLDKARGVGGRLATRRVAEGVFDHGAQYFTARDEQFQSFVKQWEAEGVVKVWSQGFYAADGQRHYSGENRYFGAQGMTQIAKTLAKNLTIHLETRIEQLDWHAPQWVVNGAYQAEALILTPPAEQSLGLFKTGNFHLPSAALAALAAIQYDPCLAVMARLDQPTRIPSPGGLWINSPNIHWLADNFQKGISPHFGVTLHATPSFTRQHWETDKEEVAGLLLAEVKEWLGGQVLATSVQRWRYSQPTVLHPERCLALSEPAPLIFAGDAFGGSRVEGAALSGIAAAEQLLKMWQH